MTPELQIWTPDEEELAKPRSHRELYNWQRTRIEDRAERRQVLHVFDPTKFASDNEEEREPRLVPLPNVRNLMDDQMEQFS